MKNRLCLPTLSARYPAPWLGFVPGALLFALLVATAIPFPLSAQPAQPDALASSTNPEAEGPGPQILTADLLARQELRADKIIAHWTFVGASQLKEITINGQPQKFEPGDTVSMTREFVLKISQTVVTVTATDSKGDKRVASYLLVNPGLPLKETETVAMAPEKLPEVRTDLIKQQDHIKSGEAEVQALFAKTDFSDWSTDPTLADYHDRQIRLGLYPIWMEARSGSPGAPLEVRAVYRPLPTDAVTSRSYWGITPHQYNLLVDDLTKRGYQQIFREVLPTDNGSWRVQTAWILKLDRG